MKVFRTLLGYIGTVPDDEPDVKQAAATVPSPPANALADALKEKPRATWGTAPIAPATIQPPVKTTAPPPSMAEALKKKRSK